MNLVRDWKRLIHKTWSIRLAILSALLSGAEVVLPMFVDAMPRNIFAGLSMIAAVAAGVSRVVAQPKMYESEPHDRRLSDRSFRMRND